MVKEASTKAYQAGTPAPAMVKDRSNKRRIKVRLESSVDKESIVEVGEYQKDVMKAAANLEGTMVQRHKLLW
jgi:hypothetical protein